MTRYHKISFIFVIAMVDLVGIDVHMSNITILKILTLVPSTALNMCFIEPLSAVIYYINLRMFLTLSLSLSLCPQLLRYWKFKIEIVKIRKVNCYFFKNLKENLYESYNGLLLKIYIATISGLKGLVLFISIVSTTYLNMRQLRAGWQKISIRF